MIVIYLRVWITLDFVCRYTTLYIPQIPARLRNVSVSVQWFSRKWWLFFVSLWAGNSEFWITQFCMWSLTYLEMKWNEKFMFAVKWFFCKMNAFKICLCLHDHYISRTKPIRILYVGIYLPDSDFLRKWRTVILHFCECDISWTAGLQPSWFCMYV